MTMILMLEIVYARCAQTPRRWDLPPAKQIQVRVVHDEGNDDRHHNHHRHHNRRHHHVLSRAGFTLVPQCSCGLRLTPRCN